MAIVMKGMLAAADGLSQFRVIDQGGRCPAFFQGERVEKRLHGRTRLPWRENSVVTAGVRLACDPPLDLVALMVNNEDSTVADAALREASERRIQHLLSHRLDTVVECGSDLRGRL